jgi:hypothetical protein
MGWQKRLVGVLGSRIPGLGRVVSWLSGLLDPAKACPVCPRCRAVGFDLEQHTRVYAAPFGPAEPYDAETLTCWTCGESGDWRGVSEANLDRARTRADQASVSMMLDELAVVGLCRGHIEREAGLLGGTLGRWARGPCPPEGLDLLREWRGRREVCRDLDALWEAGLIERKGRW